MVFAMPNMRLLKEAANLEIVLQILKRSSENENKEIASAAESQYKIGLQEYKTLSGKAATVSYIELD